MTDPFSEAIQTDLSAALSKALHKRSGFTDGVLGIYTIVPRRKVAPRVRVAAVATDPPVERVVIRVERPKVGRPSNKDINKRRKKKKAAKASRRRNRS